MKKFTEWMEKHFVPIAAKIGAEKHLVAIRDAFITILPVTMAGSIATLLSVIFRDVPKLIWPGTSEVVDGAIQTTNSETAESIAEAMKWLIEIDGNVWFGTLAMLALIFSYSIGFYLARAYEVDKFTGGIVTLVSFIIVTPQAFSIATAPEGGFTAAQTAVIDELGLASNGVALTASGVSTTYTSATGLFTALIVGFISAFVYIALVKGNVTIKMPDGVPPAVSKAFAGLIPACSGMFVASILAYLVTALGGGSIHALISENIQKPFMGASQGLGWIILLAILTQLLWFFGIHGQNVLAPIMESLYTPALIENMEKVNAGNHTDLYLWTRGSWDAYLWVGGSGAVFGLLIAIFVFSKKPASKEIAKIAIPMSCFNINEPVVFGLPIVLNPIYFIPWILVPVVSAIISYSLTAIGFAAPISLQVPWVTPPVLNAFLASGFDFGATITSIICLAAQFAIWAVFVIVANSVKTAEEE